VVKQDNAPQHRTSYCWPTLTAGAFVVVTGLLLARLLHIRLLAPMGFACSVLGLTCPCDQLARRPHIFVYL
jgi:hypothetical protein